MAEQSIKNAIFSRLKGAVSADLPDADITQWVVDGLRDMLRILKQQNALTELVSFTRKAVTGATSNLVNIPDANTTDGLALVLRKHNSGTGEYYSCREVSILQQAKVKDPMSAEYATAQHPVYYHESRNVINVFPAPTANDVVDVYALDSFASIDQDDLANSTESALDYVPDGYWNGIIYYCTSEASLAMYYKLGTVIEDLTYNSITNIPRFEIDSISYQDNWLPIGDIDDLTLPTTVSDNLPTFTLPAISLPSPPDYDAPSVNVDKISVNKYLSEEDKEMSDVALSKVNMQLTEYSQDIQNKLNEYSKNAKVYETESAKKLKDYEYDFNERLEEYRAELQAKLAEYEAGVAKASKEHDADLAILVKEYETTASAKLKDAEMQFTKEMQNIQNQIAKYQTHVQAYTQEVTKSLGEMQSSVTQNNAAAAIYLQAHSMYRQKYLEFMKVQPGPGPQQQQQQPQARQGGRNAR